MTKKKTETEELVIIEETPISNGTQQMVKHESLSLMPMKDMEKWYKEFKSFNEKLLTKGLDYGTIPGISKPSLFKPGAEKMRFVYGLGIQLQLISEESNFNSDPAFFDYTYRATVLSKTGQILAQCDGNCNSHEPKFRYTWMNTEKPEQKADENKMIAEKKGKWQKVGAAWQWRERIENPDMAGLKNTIMKMSQKRSFVGAMLIATGASEYFTQDIEDMDIGKEEEGPKDADTPKAEPAKTVTPAPVAKPTPEPAAKPAAEAKKEPVKPVAKPEPVKTGLATEAAKPEATKKEEAPTVVADPRQSIIGEGVEGLTEQDLSILAVHKAKVDAYTIPSELRSNAEELVFNCMMDGLTTDKAQPFRAYMNSYYHFLKAEAAKKAKKDATPDK